MQVVKLSQKHTELLKTFCEECSQAGFENNASLASMKWGSVYDTHFVPDYWALIVNGEIASISGSNSLDENYRDVRCLFRSATLPRYNNIVSGLSKNHMNSVPFSILLPHQIAYGLVAGAKNFYITTSHGDHDASGKMNRTHRAISLVAKNGLVDLVGERVIFDVPQTLWKINLKEYFRALRAFSETRQRLNIEEKDFDKIFLETVQKGLDTL